MFHWKAKQNPSAANSHKRPHYSEGNSPMTGEFPAQKASKAENVSIWLRHHGGSISLVCLKSV